MFSNHRVICVIPARVASSRFPGKILSLLQGKPLIQWVWEAAKACSCFDTVICAVDAPETAALISAFNGDAVVTGVQCQNGTDRLIDLYKQGHAKGDIWVNWQADQPFITPSMIQTLLSTIDNPEEVLWTLTHPMDDTDAVDDPNAVKVVADSRGRALYFSRACLPYMRNKNGTVFKHIGIYAFRHTILDTLALLSPCELEEAESLEQLRFLYHGVPIQVHTVQDKVLSVDNPADLKKAEIYLASGVV